MSFLKKYRIVMIVLTAFLIVLLGIMATAQKTPVPNEKTSGKIMVSRWCIL